MMILGDARGARSTLLLLRRRRHAQAKKLGDKDLDDIKTLMEEVEIRISETKRDTLDFKRDIILGAEDPKTGKTQADKVTRGASLHPLHPPTSRSASSLSY